MRRRLQMFVLAMSILFGSIGARAQSNGSQLIDEFSKLNSETAVVRLQMAMNKLSDRVNAYPNSLLEFVIYRGQDQSIGEPYHTFGTQKAFYAAEHYDTRRIVLTVCDSRPDPYTEIWLIDSLAQRHGCKVSEIPILSFTTLFVSALAPNDKYEMGTCCMIDEVAYAASMETVNSFAQFVIDRPGTTAYVVVYGGTNIFWWREGDGPEKSERHIDSPSFLSKLGKDVSRRLLDSGLNRSRFILVNGGYRDRYASIDLWIVPPGGKRPKPTPDYFPKAHRAKKETRNKKRL